MDQQVDDAVPLASSVGSVRTSLWGVAASTSGVWAVGTFVDPQTDNNDPLLFHETAGSGTWSVVDGPVPGTGSNILGSVTAAGGHLWADGVFDNGGNARPYVETTP